MAKQRRRRAIAAQRCAVDFDELALDLVAGLLQLEHASRQVRLASAGRAGQQNRSLRAHRHALYLFDQGVETLVARRDAALEKVLRFHLGLVETLRQNVVAREV